LSAMHVSVAGGDVAWVWCTDLPHRVHLLTFLSLLGYVSHVFSSRGMLP
jgi:hypothetical protein